MRRQDCTLHVKSGLETEMKSALDVDGCQYGQYEDNENNYQPFLEIPFLASSLKADQSAYNKEMSAARISVE